MRKLSSWFCLLLVIAAQLTALPLYADELAKPLARVELSDGDSFVFLGDSITHQCLYTQYVEDFLYTRMPAMRLKTHNSGVGGAKAWDALERFDADVAAYKPKYVSVLLGMNDGRYQPYDEETFRTYHQDMLKVVQQIQEIGAVPILMTPTMFDSRAARIRMNPNRPHPPERLELYNSVMSYYGAWLREVAVESGHGFVDMFSPLNNITLQERKTDANFTVIADAVHPDAPGQVIMAVAMIEGMGLQGPLSSIRITLPTKGEPKGAATGGKLTELTWEDEKLFFTWTADGLPWVLPQEAQLGAKLTKLGHRFSREALEIHGLPAGKYKLVIDGVEAGTYPAAAFERHIELQENAKTPQYQQALTVANLNKERNDGPVKSMRNEWRVFQGYARTKAELAASPDNQGLQNRVAELASQVEGLGARVKEHEAAAKVIEDKIFEMNQPQPRRFELIPVKD